jgi:hypothetical protein
MSAEQLILDLIVGQNKPWAVGGLCDFLAVKVRLLR